MGLAEQAMPSFIHPINVHWLPSMSQALFWMIEIYQEKKLDKIPALEIFTPFLFRGQGELNKR